MIIKFSFLNFGNVWFQKLPMAKNGDGEFAFFICQIRYFAIASPILLLHCSHTAFNFPRSDEKAFIWLFCGLPHQLLNQFFLDLALQTTLVCASDPKTLFGGIFWTTELYDCSSDLTESARGISTVFCWVNHWSFYSFLCFDMHSESSVWVLMTSCWFSISPFLRELFAFCKASTLFSSPHTNCRALIQIFDNSGLITFWHAPIRNCAAYSTVPERPYS